MTPPDDETIRALEESLRHSPDNVPLLRHLGDVLSRGGRYREAEQRYREALRFLPDDDELRLSLADCYLQRGRHNHAGVLLDLLVQREFPLPGTFLLQARIRMREGDVRGASSSFKRAVEADPSLADSELATRLGFAPAKTREIEEEDDEDEEEEYEDEDEYEEPLRHAVGPDNHGAQVELETPTCGYGDVGGMERAKRELSIKSIGPLQHPDLFAAYGKGVGGSLLMFGPPGCGKATVARAVAGEAGMNFVPVASHSVLEMWLGQSERNLHSVFKLARDNSPCVLYFQEVGLLLGRGIEAGQRLSRQFLTELAGSVDSNEGVLVLASTDSPWALDPTLVNAFEQTLFVGPPDPEERAAIFELMMRGRPYEGIDLAALVSATEGFSGGELKRTLALTTEAKLREALDSGTPEPITGQDFVSGAARVHSTVSDWFELARDQATPGATSFWFGDVQRPESA